MTVLFSFCYFKGYIFLLHVKCPTRCKFVHYVEINLILNVRSAFQHD